MTIDLTGQFLKVGNKRIKVVSVKNDEEYLCRVSDGQGAPQFQVIGKHYLETSEEVTRII